MTNNTARNIATDFSMDELIREINGRAHIGGDHMPSDAHDIAGDWLTELHITSDIVANDAAYNAMQELMEAIVQINSAAWRDRAQRAYPYITAWGRYMRSNAEYIADQTGDAMRDGAPRGAYSYSTELKTWRTVADLPPDVLRNVMDYMPKFK